MLITIKLGRIKTNVYDMDVPYWFSTLKDIYLSTSQGYKKEETIDLSKIDTRTIADIYVGIKTKMIVCSESDFKTLEAEYVKLYDAQPAVAVERQPADMERINELKDNSYNEEAAVILKKTAIEACKVIGQATIDNGALLQGIDDIKLLETMLALESDKEAPRKTILACLNARIEAIKKADISAQEVVVEEAVEEVKEEIKENEESDYSNEF